METPAPSPNVRAMFDRLEDELMAAGYDLVESVARNLATGQFEAIRFRPDWDNWMTSEMGKVWHSAAPEPKPLEPLPVEAPPREDSAGWDDDGLEWWQR